MPTSSIKLLRLRLKWVNNKLMSLVLTLHILVALSLIGIILIQSSQGGLGSGFGGGSQDFMSPRGTANLLTRTTAVLAVVFVATSLTLNILTEDRRNQQSIIDDGPLDPVGEEVAPPVATVPVVPVEP